jgi:hypothetical protein
MRSFIVIVAFALLACGPEDPNYDPPDSPLPGASSSSSSGGSVGGSGGQGGEPACDPWTDEDCCEVSSFCGEGSLGACVVDIKLCDGICQGKANPIPSAPCGNMGVCEGTVCVEPEPMGGSGGQGGSGGGQ